MMLDMLKLEAEPRDVATKPAKLRKEGKLPAVLYGRKEASTPIVLDTPTFLRTWREVGESSVVSLVLPDRELQVLVHDVDEDPVRGTPLHADFYAIEADRAVEVSVPLVFEGTAPAVREQGGTLVKVLHEVTVEALPANLPHEIVVDVSSLATLESRITVSDLAVSEGVTIKEESDEVVASISAQEEETQEPETFDASAVEVEEKGKKEEETPEAEE